MPSANMLTMLPSIPRPFVVSLLCLLFVSAVSARHVAFVIWGQRSPPKPPMLPRLIPPTREREPRKKALLIGITYAKVDNQVTLPASHEDVLELRALLIEKYHYSPHDITVMMDDEDQKPHLQPTRLNILAQIAELVWESEPDDRFFFHYSGHATQLESDSLDPSEEDGKDECLIPIDFTGEMDERSELIVDDELKTHLVDALCPTSNLVAIFDACHSATMLDLPLTTGRITSSRIAGRKATLQIQGLHGSQPGRKLSILKHSGTTKTTLAPSPTSTTLLDKQVINDSRSRSEATTGGLKILEEVKTSTVIFQAPSSSIDSEISVSDFDYLKTPTTASNVEVTTTSLTRTGAILESEQEDSFFRLTGTDGTTSSLRTDGSVFSSDTFAQCMSPISDPNEHSKTYTDNNVVTFAACRDSQDAYDSERTSFTKTMISVLRENPNPTLRNLFSDIRLKTQQLNDERRESIRQYKSKLKNYRAQHEAQMSEKEKEDNMLSLQRAREMKYASLQNPQMGALKQMNPDSSVFTL